MTARQPSVGTFAWMHDVVRTEENLWRQGLITAREAVEVMIARLTCLDVELRLTERVEAEYWRVVPGLDEALDRMLTEGTGQ